MRYLFFCPHYHTNMVPLVEGLMHQGDAVMICVSHEGIIEDHVSLTPVFLEESFLSVCLRKTFSHFSKKDSELLFNTCFLPRRHQISKIIKNFKPDVVIVRNYSFFSLRVYSVAKKRVSCSVVVYDQNFLKHCLLEGHSLKAVLRRAFFPRLRYTPVDDPTSDLHLFISPHCRSYFVPFVIDSAAYQPPQRGNYISVLSVGKYRDYKNLFFLVDSFLVARSSADARLTIVGQCESDEEKRYYQSLRKYVSLKKADDEVRLLTGIPYRSMPSLYLSSDLFVLCSKHDQANISVLESMSFGRPVISTDANGTACYITRSNGGIVYPSGDSQSLSEALFRLISDDDLRTRLGVNAHQYIKRMCNIDNFERNITEIVGITSK